VRQCQSSGNESIVELAKKIGELNLCRSSERVKTFQCKRQGDEEKFKAKLVKGKCFAIFREGGHLLWKESLATAEKWGGRES
jgi:hypothetical protein